MSSAPCRCCKGNKYVTIKMRGNSKTDGLPIYGTCVCPQCVGKGYTDHTDATRVQSVEQYDQIVG